MKYFYKNLGTLNPIHRQGQLNGAADGPMAGPTGMTIASDTSQGLNRCDSRIGSRLIISLEVLAVAMLMDQYRRNWVNALMQKKSSLIQEDILMELWLRSIMNPISVAIAMVLGLFLRILGWSWL